MKQDLFIYQSPIHIFEKIGFIFFASLTDKYFGELNEMAFNESAIRTITFIDKEQFSGNAYPVSSLTFKMPSATPKMWLSFKKWCKEREVDVFVKKKDVNRANIWWPSVIEISSADDNEWLFLSKLEQD